MAIGSPCWTISFPRTAKAGRYRRSLFIGPESCRSRSPTCQRAVCWRGACWTHSASLAWGWENARRSYKGTLRREAGWLFHAHRKSAEGGRTTDSVARLLARGFGLEVSGYVVEEDGCGSDANGVREKRVCVRWCDKSLLGPQVVSGTTAQARQVDGALDCACRACRDNTVRRQRATS